MNRALDLLNQMVAQQVVYSARRHAKAVAEEANISGPIGGLLFIQYPVVYFCQISPLMERPAVAQRLARFERPIAAPLQGQKSGPVCTCRARVRSGACAVQPNSNLQRWRIRFALLATLFDLKRARATQNHIRNKLIRLDNKLLD